MRNHEEPQFGQYEQSPETIHPSLWQMLPAKLKEQIWSKEVDPVMMPYEDLKRFTTKESPLQKKHLQRRFVALSQLELYQLGAICITMSWGEIEWIDEENLTGDLFTLTEGDLGDLEEPKTIPLIDPKIGAHEFVDLTTAQQLIQAGGGTTAETAAASVETEGTEPTPYLFTNLKHLIADNQPVQQRDVGKHVIVLTHEQIEELGGLTVVLSTGKTAYIDSLDLRWYSDDGLCIIRPDQLGNLAAPEDAPLIASVTAETAVASVETEGTEPTNQEIAEACREVVTVDEYESMVDLADQMTLEEFLCYTQLILEARVPDPDDYLESKGILRYFGP